jgi:hypothetical protein
MNLKRFALLLLSLNLGLAAYFLARDFLPASAVPAERAPLNVDRLSLRSQATSRPQANAPSAPASNAFCVEWRGLSLGEFGRVREQLKDVVSERVMSFSEVPVDTRYWVVFPPLPSAEAAVLKLSEFSAAGVPDAQLVNDGIWKNAISLGLYGNDETARRRVREVESRGILGTRVELQPMQGTDYYFVIRSEDSEALKNLSELKAAYPNSQLTRVACQLP